MAACGNISDLAASKNYDNDLGVLLDAHSMHTRLTRALKPLEKSNKK
jgi:hypothetical protein